MIRILKKVFEDRKARREKARHEQLVRDMVPILESLTVGHPSFCQCDGCSMLSVLRVKTEGK
jgi:hypothetical protein